jgi:hypothetical protein
MDNKIIASTDKQTVKEKILSLSANDSKVSAIRFVRSVFGWGLRECVEYVDKILINADMDKIQYFLGPFHPEILPGFVEFDTDYWLYEHDGVKCEIMKSTNHENYSLFFHNKNEGVYQKFFNNLPIRNHQIGRDLIEDIFKLYDINLSEVK